MSAILYFLSSIGRTIEALLNFVIHSIMSLVQLITALPGYVATLANLVALIPTVFQGIILATIGIAVLFTITGRK